ncbi:UNVERIFIED_CONTAM: hypothetical protein GTU68_062980 [Idotea baltica]|nr:hypothetical protein [Idotea baltica]
MSALAKEHNAINLSQGFPDFDCDPLLPELVHKHMLSGLNQYPPMRGVQPLLEGIAEKYNALHGISIDPETEVTVTVGAVEGVFSAVAALVRSGDEVIIIEPAFDLYIPATLVNGGVPVVYTLKAPDFEIDWQAIRDLVTEKTKLIIVNTPHNPIGKVMTRSDFEELEKLVQETGIYVISDEVYEHLVFDHRKHVSLLEFPGLYERGFAVFSFGKTYHITGWRVGYCIAPRALTEEFRKVHQFTVFTVSTPLQHALSDYMQDSSKYLALGKFFERKRDLLQRALQASRFRPLESEGSYFQIYDYSEISDSQDLDFVKRLTHEHGVASIPMSVFYTNPDPKERLIRLCFAKKDETLEAAAMRLCKV